MSRCSLVVDCGTTNLRVTLLDEKRQRLDAVKTEGGVRHTAIDGHNGRLRAMLRESMQTVLARNGYAAQDVTRCVAYGMITSALGLAEIPHVPAPAGADELRAAMQTRTFEDVAPFPITFIPGVRNFDGPVSLDNFSEMDMMRGEEVEAIGLHKLLSPRGAAMLVLPGTHNKFVSMDAQGRILGCMTSISGELLDAMTHHTILSDAVGGSFLSAQEYDTQYVQAGARECAVSGLGRAAFAGRILRTLGQEEPAQIRSYLLGAALALDVQAMQAFVGEREDVEAYIAGKPPLQQGMCDVMEALCAGEATQVPAELSARMGLEGALAIAF